MKVSLPSDVASALLEVLILGDAEGERGWGFESRGLSHFLSNNHKLVVSPSFVGLDWWFTTSNPIFVKKWRFLSLNVNVMTDFLAWTDQSIIGSNKVTPCPWPNEGEKQTEWNYLEIPGECTLREVHNSLQAWQQFSSAGWPSILLSSTWRVLASTFQVSTF